MGLHLSGSTTTALNNAYGRQTLFLGTGGTADQSAALQAVVDGMKVGGHLTGTLVVKGSVRLSTGIVLDGGYTDLTNPSGANWSTGAGEQFKFIVEGRLKPDAAIGNAVTAKGLRLPVLDLYFEGGGQSSDNALHLENVFGMQLDVRGNNFAGTLLHADANGDATKNVSQATVRRIHATKCGRTLYMRNINAFGAIHDIWDNGCTTGSTMDTCADTSILHLESFSPASQTYGWQFINCGGQQHGIFNLGDRASTALLRISGGNFGTIGTVRCTAYQSGANPTEVGVLLEDVQSVVIEKLHTDHCAKALHSKGGDVMVGTLLSEGGDGNVVYVEAGSSRTAPVLDIGIRSFYNQLEAVYVASTVTGGTLRLHGVIDTPNNLGDAAKYAVNCQATGMAVDVTGLKEYGQAVLAGSVLHADLTKLRGLDRAYLSKPLGWGTAPAAWAGFTQGTDYQNTDPRPMVVCATFNMSPSAGNDAYCTTSLGPPGAGYTQVMQEVRKNEAGITQYAYTLYVPPGWYYKAALINSTVNSVKRYYL